MTWFYSIIERRRIDQKLDALYWAMQECILAYERICDAFEVNPANLKMRGEDLARVFDNKRRGE